MPKFENMVTFSRDSIPAYNAIHGYNRSHKALSQRDPAVIIMTYIAH